jgi:predicted enzyme related to lactoylglutathione lyase
MKMQLSRNALNWFEIPVNNFERAKTFYSQIFNYEMQENQMGPNRMGFLLYDSSNGSIGGAIVQGPDYIPSQRGALVYLNAGPDLQEVLERVEPAGGKIEIEKTPVSNDETLGYFAIIHDVAGNRLALHSMQ